MIHSFFIINPDGEFIFSHYFIKSNFDKNLIIKFLSLIKSFSQENIGGKLRKFEVRIDEKLVFYCHEPSKLIIAAIINANDHPSLIEHLLCKIITKFYETYKINLSKKETIENTSQFREVCYEILAGRTINRGFKQLFLGLFLGMTLLCFLIILTLSVYLEISLEFRNSIANIITQNREIITMIVFISGWDFTDPLSWIQASIITNFIFNEPVQMLVQFFNISFSAQLLLLSSFIPSSLLGGNIAGNRRNGKWIGFLFFIAAIILLSLIAEGNRLALLLYYIAVYLPLILICSIIFAYLGGFICELFKLYPFPPDSEFELVKGLPIAKRGILTTLFYVFIVFGSIIFVIGLSIKSLLIVGLILIILAIISERKESKKF
ncbi:MAG: hypothetical protein HWN67_18250 [Candidatus Helarchaeota archaeon]|nr:hypothetical protein [Candidatus Helarchaeota archaeon]